MRDIAQIEDQHGAGRTVQLISAAVPNGPQQSAHMQKRSALPMQSMTLPSASMPPVRPQSVVPNITAQHVCENPSQENPVDVCADHDVIQVGNECD